MAFSDNLKNSAEEIKRLNDLGTEFQAIYGDIGTILNGLAKNSQDFSSAIKDSGALSKDLSKSAQELAKFTKEDLADRKARQKFDAKSQELTKKRANLESQIRVFRSKIVNATDEEKEILLKVVENLDNQLDYTRQIGKGYEDIVEATSKIERSNPFKGAAEFLDEIPILGKVLGEFSNATDVFNKSMAEGNGKLQSTVKGFKELGGVVAKFTLGLAIAGLKDFGERTVSVSRNLNVSREQSDALVKSANKFARTNEALGVTGKDITNSQLAFSEALGTSATLSNETAANFSTLQTKLGLSVEQATELTKLNTALGLESKDQTENLIGQVRVLNAQTDSAVKYQEVAKDVAGTNKATLLTIQGQGKSLAVASFEAKKLGLSLNQVDNIAGSLLNFEESISAELEAELLTGKQLNLEKAREAALNGDLATVTAEIAKNVGSAEEFSKMNRIQQEAIAKSVGMTREDLAASLVEQQALTKLGAKDKNELNAKLKTRLQEINAIEDVQKREEARAKLIEEAGSEELIRQQENRTIQEQQALLTQKMLEAFDKLSPILTLISKAFTVMSENVEIIVAGLVTISGLTLFSKFKKLGKIFSKLRSASKFISKSFGKGTASSVKDIAKSSEKVATATMKATGKQVSGAAAQAAVKAGTATATKTIGKSATKAVGKTAAKTAGKSLLKKIPGVGLIAGLAFAAERLAAGDLAGAGLEVASGAAGLIPGVGTAASLVIDAGIAARDISKAKADSSAPEAADFISRPGQPIQKFRKDDIIVGGTNLGGGDNGEVVTLLKELIAAVNNGGDVYMDSTKVGTAMTVGSYKLQ